MIKAVFNITIFIFLTTSNLVYVFISGNLPSRSIKEQMDGDEFLFSKDFFEKPSRDY